MTNSWLILTGEYPPDAGGVSDYTWQVVGGLAGRGDVVHVCAPNRAARPQQAGVVVHDVDGAFHPRGLPALGRRIDALRPSRLLLQYTPQAFGYYGTNWPLCRWIARRPEELWVMFHEVYTPWQWSPPHATIAVMTRLMARTLVRAATRVFVSIPAWERLLRPMNPQARIQWLPIASNVPTEADAMTVSGLRQKLAPDGAPIIGTFGTFGGHIVQALGEVLPLTLRRHERAVVLLIGRGAQSFADAMCLRYPHFKARMHVADGISPEQVAQHLCACDLLIQPFGDGISSRRSSAMAGLALGLPMVTTRGFLSEDLWETSGAVALAPAGNIEAQQQQIDRLLADPGARRELGVRARELYRSRFDLEHLLGVLREESGESA